LPRLAALDALAAPIAQRNAQEAQEATQYSLNLVHDSFHDQLATSGSHITLSDGVEITLSDGLVIRFRAIDLQASDYLGR